MPRVAFSMTIDPDGAMHDWVDAPEGWSVMRIPTQELVHLLGPTDYRRLLLDLCEKERPELLVTHPPYDWLNPQTAARLRAAGTLVVGYAFDDEIFAAEYSTNVRAEIARIYDRYLTTRELRWATRPLPALAMREPEHDVVLVGRAYQRRRDLVESLRAAGLGVETRGLGWPEGFVSRAALLDLYSRAAVVLTTADWESRAVPMVKHRLLDTAMLGCFQIAQEAPDLRGYFSDEEVPSFGDGHELVARVKAALADPESRRRSAAAARRRAVAEHTWTQRFPQLVAGLSLPPRAEKKHERSYYFDGALTALASRAESDGRIAAAEALWREVAERELADAEGSGKLNPTVAAGLGRCLRDLGRLEEALDPLRRAAQSLSEESTCAGAVTARLPAFGVGTGLGKMGLLPPRAEATLWWIATLVELDRIAEAAQILNGLIGPVAEAVAGAMTFGDRPELQPVRDALERLKVKGRRAD